MFVSTCDSTLCWCIMCSMHTSLLSFHHECKYKRYILSKKIIDLPFRMKQFLYLYVCIFVDESQFAKFMRNERIDWVGEQTNFTMSHLFLNTHFTTNHIRFLFSFYFIDYLIDITRDEYEHCRSTMLAMHNHTHTCWGEAVFKFKWLQCKTGSNIVRPNMYIYFLNQTVKLKTIVQFVHRWTMEFIESQKSTTFDETDDLIA